MMKTNNKSRFLLCGFLLIALTACESKQAPSSSPYPVYDSGMWADPVYSPAIYWLDNDRMIFKGTSAKQKTDAYQYTELQIWDIKQITVTPYAKTTKGISCYAEGNIFYWVPGDKPGEDRYRYGKLGHEETHEFTKDKKIYSDPINCRADDAGIVVKERKGRAITPLLNRHGYLDIGPISGKESLENNPIIFYRADGSVIQLPVRRAERGSLYKYFPFKDAYLFEGVSRLETPSDIAQLWPPGARHMFWLHPDGRIEPVVLPETPWKDRKVPGFGLHHLVPLKEGFFVIYGKPINPKNPGTVGGYLLRGEKLTKVVGGYLDSLTVSPDGCKVAFVHYPYADATLAADPAPIRLKAIDLCTKQTELTLSRYTLTIFRWVLTLNAQAIRPTKLNVS